MNLRGIEVKTTEQIQAMRKAGLVVAEALIAMGEAARPEGARTQTTSRKSGASGPSARPM